MLILGGQMGGTGEHNGVLECDNGHLQSRLRVGLAEEIGRAARSDLPVLITGDPNQGWEIACAIDRRSRRPKGTVEVVDCRRLGALELVLSHAERRRNGTRSILLLQEIHALSLHEQAQFEHRLAELRLSRRNSGPRIIASSSTPLFQRVLEGSFDERLYYRLNVIQMIVR
jgi:DNA-binding NtrC family response regulator